DGPVVAGGARGIRCLDTGPGCLTELDRHHAAPLRRLEPAPRGEDRGHREHDDGEHLAHALRTLPPVSGGSDVVGGRVGHVESGFGGTAYAMCTRSMRPSNANGMRSTYARETAPP